MNKNRLMQRYKSLNKFTEGVYDELEDMSDSLALLKTNSEDSKTKLNEMHDDVKKLDKKAELLDG